MGKIKNIEARKILDSRGGETVEVKISTDSGILVTDSVPSGTSTGSFEAMVLEPSIAINNVNNIIKPKIIGMDPVEQNKIDQIMLDLDGTQNKSKLGANAILGVSLAVARAAAGEAHQPLYKYLNTLFNTVSGLNVKPVTPTPMMVMIEGGKHAKNSKTCIQEFLVIAGLENGGKIWNRLKRNLARDGYGTAMGLEGGFTPELEYDEDAIRLIVDAATDEGLVVNQHYRMGLDVAGNQCQMSQEDIISLIQRYPIYSLEDPFSENEWTYWSQLKHSLGQIRKDYLLIGDDLFVTNLERLQKGTDDLVANGIIIKINQAGTLSETLTVIAHAIKAQYTHILSHRSGETMDTFISDLAVATASRYLKSGAPFATERVIKYNRLKEINDELQSSAK